MSPLVTARYHRRSASPYAGLLTAGKPKTLALISAIRKLLTIPNGPSPTARHGAHPNPIDLPRQSLTPFAR